MSFEIGGFALDEFEVDGDWEIFNYGVAENYYDAMLGEEFDFLGDASVDFIERIEFWLNYDGEIGRGYEEQIAKIRTGLFMTCKSRTFIDAIVANKNISFAETYIQLGSRDVRLFVICLFGVEIGLVDGEEIYDGTILNMINKFCNNREDYIGFLLKFFNLLESEYNKLENDNERIEFLKVVRNNINKFRYNCSKQISLNEVCDTGFIRKLINK